MSGESRVRHGALEVKAPVADPILARGRKLGGVAEWASGPGSPIRRTGGGSMSGESAGIVRHAFLKSGMLETAGAAALDARGAMAADDPGAASARIRV